MIFHVDPAAVADAGTELDIQARFIGRMRKLAPDIKVVATPNGGKRTAWEGMKAKREGMVAGWPDVTCFWSNGIDENAIPGLCMIEFKARGGRLSDEQIHWGNWLTRHGFRFAVCRSAETAVEFVRASGAPFLLHQEDAA